MALLFSCWEQIIPWTRAKVWEPWKKTQTTLDCLISVSQEKQTKKAKRKQHKQPPHTQNPQPRNEKQMNKTKQNKHKTNRNKPNTAEQSSKSTKEKPICQNPGLFFCILKHLHLKIKI